jgi:GT2 family glycosyltransferase
MVDRHLAIIILNWNNANDTVFCLDSLVNLEYPAFQIFIIDNGSTDDSVAQIQKSFPDIEVIQTGQNLGYAGGNNVGIKEALTRGFDYIAIINNDIRLDPEAIPHLIKYLDNAVGDVVTSLIVEFPSETIVWALGSQVNHRTGYVNRIGAGDIAKKWQNTPPFCVDAVSGAMFIAKREVFEKVGLLDEKFFLYYEEIDWSLRVKLAGYTIQAVPSAIASHKVSATLGVTSPIIDYYMLRNHLYLISKHWTVPVRWLLLARIVLRNLLAILAFTVKPYEGRRIPNRNARLLALRDVALGKYGMMGLDVTKICCPVK